MSVLCVCTLSCLTLCVPMNGGPPGSSVHGILQARIVELVAISYSRDLSNPETKSVSLVSPASPALAGGCFTTEPTQAQFNLRLSSPLV